MPTILDQIQEAVMDGLNKPTLQLVEQALAAGVDPGAILNQALLPPMTQIGGQFERREVYIPEMMLSAARCARRSIC